MISAVIIAQDRGLTPDPSAEALVRTLAALVPAAIEGLIRDVTLAGLKSHGQLFNIADHAGCELAQADDLQGVIAAGLKSARSDLVLLLCAGFAPNAGYVDEIGDRFQSAQMSSALLLRREPETFLTRLLPQFSPVRGVVAKRSAFAKATSFDHALRCIGGGITARVQLRRVD